VALPFASNALLTVAPQIATAKVAVVQAEMVAARCLDGGRGGSDRKQLMKMSELKQT